MRHKVGDLVILSDPDMLFKPSIKMGKLFQDRYRKSVYIVTSVTDDYVRIEGEETGWFHHTFKTYKRGDILPEGLFEL